jgi:hypothetical protein
MQLSRSLRQKVKFITKTYFAAIQIKSKADPQQVLSKHNTLKSARSKAEIEVRLLLISYLYAS